MRVLKGILLGIAAVVAVIACVWFGAIGVVDEATSLELTVTESKENINAAIEARYVKLQNLVDCVKHYSEYEAETLRKVIEARNSSTVSGDSESITQVSTSEIQTQMNMVIEAYPELKGDTQYKQLMNEISTCENQILSMRVSYNNDVKNYNRYISKIFNKKVIEFMGYDFKKAPSLEYSTPQDGHLNLFED